MSAGRLDLEDGLVDMTHGAGGKRTNQLVDELFLAAFTHPALREKNDQATFALPPGERVVMSTDCHVVSPLFFPGGDIGKLSVCGTINDVAMSGAEPLYLAAGFILEEGFRLAELRRIVESMRIAEAETGVRIVTGDTKVVERGKADGVFITTTGVGVIRDPRVSMGVGRVSPGDVVLINGTIGDHGVAVMSHREHLAFDSSLVSDCAALHGLVKVMIDAVPTIHCLRDPTRGGVAATLNEIASGAGVGVVLDEEALPIRREVHAACDLLGLEPLDVANEGKLMAFCPAESAPPLLAAMRSHPLGAEAAVIGEVVADPRRLVQMRSPYGGRRVVPWLAGEALPRIC